MSHEWLCRAREMSRVEVVVKVVFSIGEEKAQLKRATNSRAGEARKASTQLLVFESFSAVSTEGRLKKSSLAQVNRRNAH